jgi:hypothetical protein
VVEFVEFSVLNVVLVVFDGDVNVVLAVLVVDVVVGEV